MTGFEAVCRLDRITPEGGVAALVGGRAVAVIRTHDDRVFALSNYDPFSNASVLSRGIVGTRTVEETEVPYVASPIYKHGFDLRNGRCLDDPEVSVPVHPVRVVDGMVEVGPPPGPEEESA